MNKTARINLVLNPEQKQYARDESKKLFGRENISSFICYLIENHKMKQLAYIAIMLLPFLTFAQVGIGTTNPQATLHIAGNLKIDTIPTMNEDYILVTDSDGFIGKKLSSATSPLSVQTIRATMPDRINYTTTTNGVQIDNDIDLGLGVYTVTINPAQTSLITVNYNIPIGAVNSTLDQIATYIGIKFFIDGVENQDVSRKIQMPVFSTASSLDGLSTTGLFRTDKIISTWTDVITNTTTDPILIDFEIRGVLQQARVTNTNPSQTGKTYIFGMWSATGDNLNWGKGSLTIQQISF